MRIISDTITDANAAAVDCEVTFEWKGLPAGFTQQSQQRTVRAKTLAADGTFSVHLEQGYWEVQYFNGQDNRFTILVPSGTNNNVAVTMASLRVSPGG